jgi:hypothetical protein
VNVTQGVILPRFVFGKAEDGSGGKSSGHDTIFTGLNPASR